MFSKPFVIASALLLTLARARLGREGEVQGVIAAIGGNDGQAATLAGESIGTLLGGANACAKLKLADRVASLDGAGALDAAKALVQAEQNFDPFAVDIPSICSDPTLPATEGLRGIIPLIDPAVVGADVVNIASAESLDKPVAAEGKSVADLLTDIGFTNFTAQDVAGNNNAGDAHGDAAGNNGNGNGNGNGDENVGGHGNGRGNNNPAADGAAAGDNGNGNGIGNGNGGGRANNYDNNDGAAGNNNRGGNRNHKLKARQERASRTLKARRLQTAREILKR
ncbi:hypothetical protein HOY80DRAFT_915273 [Tuber brumale]|nr:hypothetical protein HOY80DRAFT_915273 [Tuber brumale]